MSVTGHSFNIYKKWKNFFFTENEYLHGLLFLFVFEVPDWQELHHMANSLAGRIYQASFGQDYYTIGKFINQ